MTSVSLASMLIGTDGAPSGRGGAAGDGGSVFDAVLALLGGTGDAADAPVLDASADGPPSDAAPAEASGSDAGLLDADAPAAAIWFAAVALPPTPVPREDGIASTHVEPQGSGIPSAAPPAPGSASSLLVTETSPASAPISEAVDRAAADTAPIRVIAVPAAPAASVGEWDATPPSAAEALAPHASSGAGRAPAAAASARPAMGELASPRSVVSSDAAPLTPMVASASSRESLPIRADASATASPTAAVGIAAQIAPTATPVSKPAMPTVTPRAVAAQISPVVVNIVQRPAGTHQLTLTVTPETLGPVTVRAHIGQGGDIRVELVGATDAGRDALRAIVADLRRDLTAAMPTATLSLGSGGGAEAGSSDRGMPHSGGDGLPHRPSQGRPAPLGAVDGEGDSLRHAPVPTRPASGAGLDILV